MPNAVFGGKELEAALKQLPKATAKGVLRRALKKASEPTVIAAEALAPRGPTGELAKSNKIGATLKKSQRGDQGFTFSGGNIRQAAKSEVTIYIGPTGKWGSLAHIKEFGSLYEPAHPFLRPAWDATKNKVLATMESEIWKALAKSARTLARKAERGTLSKAARKVLG